MLNIFDADQNALETDLITNHNGYTGGSFEIKFHIKNLDPAYYYKNTIITPVMANGELPVDNIFSTTGWSVKLSYGSEQPTENDWSKVTVNSELQLADIGTTNAADTSTYHPVWMRIYCPGGTTPEVKTNMSLTLKYDKRLVNA